MKTDWLRVFLQQLKDKGLSRDEIIKHLYKKGVDKKKGELVVDAYLGESENSSDLIFDTNNLEYSEKELDEIRDILKKDIDEESGLKKIVEQPSIKTIPKQASEPVHVSNSNVEIANELLNEFQALSQDFLKRNEKESAMEEQLETIHQEITLIKEENARLSNEIKRLDSESGELRKVLIDISNTVKEMRKRLK